MNKKPNNFPLSQKTNPNSNKNKILQNINSLFNPKSQVQKNSKNKNDNIIHNPFNMGNSKIKNGNFSQIPLKQIIYNNTQPNREDSLKLNLDINNEIVEQKGSIGNNNKNPNNNNMEMGQSPIFENEANSAFIGQNSNDYKLIEQLLENKKSNDKNDQKNNENINSNENIFSPPNNNNNNNIMYSGFNKINANIINNNNNYNNQISNFNNNNISISDDIRNQVDNLNLSELNPSWFQDESNYKDPLYFEKLKKFEFMRLGIKSLKLSDFLIGKKLGSGQFGHVYLAKLKSTQFICAIKVINKKRLLKESLKCINQVRREIEIQSHLHHPNILSIYNFFWDKKNIYLVIEYANGGELFQILHNEENGRFSEPKAAFYVEQVCNAIEYIHKLNVIHRDIKPENILLSNETIKLADFGWSIHQKSNKSRPTFCGTAEYMPPEVINGEAHIPPSDLWCLGILIYELCAGVPPFNAKNNAETIHKIKIFKMRDYPEYFSEECKDLIGKLIKRSSKDRITIQEVKNHPWIINNVKKYKQKIFF